MSFTKTQQDFVLTKTMLQVATVILLIAVWVSSIYSIALGIVITLIGLFIISDLFRRLSRAYDQTIQEAHNYYTRHYQNDSDQPR